MIPCHGSAWPRSLDGHCGGRNRLAIAEGGSVWLTSADIADEWDAARPVGLYVITPGAMVATESQGHDDVREARS